MSSDIEKHFELLGKTYSEAWSSATVYTNFVMIAGYAGYFGLISITKDYVSPVCIIISSLFLSISLAVFVFHEIFKVMLNTLHCSSKVRDAENKNINGLRSVILDQDKCNSRGHRVWLWCFIFSVLFGLLAVIVLLYSIISTIIHCCSY